MTYTFITLNVQGYAHWAKREANIVAYLDSQDADFVLLQEVRFDETKSSRNQAETLNSRLRQPYKYFASAVARYYQPREGDPYKEGLAILSRFPIIKSEVLALTKRPDDKHQRLIQNVDIDVPERLKLSNVHFSNNQYSAEQLAEVISIFSLREERRIIAGDFNIFDLSASEDLFGSDYMASVEYRPYVSYPSENRTLDYILLPREYGFNSLETTENLSDHAAVYFEVNA